jgi:DtxR family transcriptional regulator, Mn-dependent transcriptional regulator
MCARPATSTIDRYLESIYCIDGEGETVRPGRLSQWMGVSPPTVTDALRRMDRDGLVAISEDRSVELTLAGRERATSIVRRHRILERWLTDVLGLDWAVADEEADRLSSAMSELVVEQIDASMGKPSTCPHGNPIPGRKPAYGTLVPLVTIPDQASVRVRRISEVAEHEARPLLKRLSMVGIKEGSDVVIESRDGEGGALTIVVDGTPSALPAEAARWIWVDAGA